MTDNMEWIEWFMIIANTSTNNQKNNQSTIHKGNCGYDIWMMQIIV
jgi:hypothetical protein